MDTKQEASERRCLIIFVVIISLIVAVVVAIGIYVDICIQGNLSKIILLSLIALLLVIGILSFLFLKWHNYYMAKKRLKVSTYQPTSWAYSKDFSRRSTLQRA